MYVYEYYQKYMWNRSHYRLIFHGPEDCGHTPFIRQMHFMFQMGNRYPAPGQHPVTWNPMDSKDHKILKLQQLYKNGSNATEVSNNATGTAGTNNVNST
jgi:hypothetical protein